MTSSEQELARFGQEVRRRRSALNLTLEGLAERCGLTPNYIGSVELGRRDPGLSTVVSLAQALEATPGELLGSVPKLSSTGVEAARLFEGVPHEVQSGVLSILRGATNPGKRPAPRSEQRRR